MKKTNLTLLFAFLVIIGSMNVTFAAGFKLSEHGAKASGMMNAFTAQADRPSAMHYNPAGIVQLDGIQAQAGFGYFIPSVAFESGGTAPLFGTAGEKTDMENNTFLVPYLYVTYKINDQWSIGFSENTPFGLGTEWKDDWEGRYIVGGTKAEVKTINLQTTIAYRPLPNVAFAFSPQYQFFDVELRNKIPNPTQQVPIPSPATDLDLKLKGDTWNFGWNISTMIWLSENLKLGAYYQSAIDHDDIEGNIDFGPSTFDATAAIELPPSAVLALAWIDKDFTVELDLLWEGWSTYDQLTADSPTFEGATGQKIAQEKNWEDSWTYSLGASYKLNPMYELRAGIRKMNGCIPESKVDPLVPSQDRWYFSLGGGVELEQLAIDASFIYLTDDVKEIGSEVGDYANDFGNPALGKVSGEFKDISTAIFNIDVKYSF